jgi:hypothetical protein
MNRLNVIQPGRVEPFLAITEYVVDPRWTTPLLTAQVAEGEETL